MKGECGLGLSITKIVVFMKYNMLIKNHKKVYHYISKEVHK